MNRWIKAGEAAKIIGYSDVRSVTRLANRGRIKWKPDPVNETRKLYDRASVEEYADVFKGWFEGRSSKEEIQDEIGTRIKREEGPDGLVIRTKSPSIRTLEEAIEEANVDLDVWEVNRHVINSWDVSMKVKQEDGTERKETVTNHQVKIWLKPRIVKPLELAIRNLIKEIPSLKTPKRAKLPKTKFAHEICPFDAHIGKLAWAKETGQADYDLKIATQMYIDAISRNLEYGSCFDVSQIYFIVGQDLLHVENYQNKTPLAGNDLDTDSRFLKIYTETLKSVIHAVYLCLEVAPTKIVWVPGNHDMSASFFLTEILKATFNGDKWLTVDNAPNWRKAQAWGNLLVAWTHDASGGKAKPTINMLPQFWPELWGQSKFREWHCGHKHKKNEEKYAPVLTVGGTVIRQIPTMSEIDAWHYQNLFTDAVPACESFIWSDSDGIPAHFTANMEAVRNDEAGSQ